MARWIALVALGALGVPGGVAGQSTPGSQRFIYFSGCLPVRAELEGVSALSRSEMPVPDSVRWGVKGPLVAAGLSTERAVTFVDSAGVAVGRWNPVYHAHAVEYGRGVRVNLSLRKMMYDPLSGETDWATTWRVDDIPVSGVAGFTRLMLDSYAKANAGYCGGEP